MLFVVEMGGSTTELDSELWGLETIRRVKRRWFEPPGGFCRVCGEAFPNFAGKPQWHHWGHGKWTNVHKGCITTMRRTSTWWIKPYNLGEELVGWSVKYDTHVRWGRTFITRITRHLQGKLKCEVIKKIRWYLKSRSLRCWLLSTVRVEF